MASVAQAKSGHKSTDPEIVLMEIWLRWRPVYEVLQVDEGHEGNGEHYEPDLDVDVGGLLGGVQVPVETEAQADPAPHCTLAGSS